MAMNNDPGTGVLSTGGIKQSGAQTPILQRQEKLDALTPQANYGQAYSSLALTPNVLGEMGARIAQSASIAYSQRQGMQAGKEPHGDLFPSITKADEAYANAYKSQAQVTLGLNAQDLIQKSHEEVAKSNMLSQESITQFTENTAQGIDEIVKLAPTDIQGSLIGQYGSQIASMTHSLNERLYAQNKERASSEASAWRLQQNVQIQDLLKDGTEDSLSKAAMINEQIKSSINNSLNIGQLSPLQAQTALQTNKLSFESGKLTGVARELYNRNDGSLDTFLSKLSTTKLKGLTWDESQQVGSNVLSYISHMDSLQSREQQILYSQNSSLVQSGQMTSDLMAQAREEMHPANYYKLESQWMAKTNKGMASNQQSLDYQKQYTDSNSALWRQGTAKDKNAAFYALSQAIVDKSQTDTKHPSTPISREEAEFQVASSGPTLPPAYKEAINNGLASGNPALMNHFGDITSKLQNSPGLKSLELDTDSLSVYHKYQSLINSGKDPIDAANEARRIVMNKNENDIKLSEYNFQQFANKQFTSIEKRNTTLEEIGGINSSNITNSSWYYSHMYDMFRTAMETNGGDVEAAKSMIKSGIGKVWNKTSINGNPNEVTLFPVEQLSHMTSDSIPLFQADLVEQLQEQIQLTKADFDENKFSSTQHYWRIVDRPSFEEYTKAKKSIVEKGPNDKDYNQNMSLVSLFQTQGPVEIEKVYRNKSIERFQVNVQAGPFTTYDTERGELFGGYDVFVVNKETGHADKMDGVYSNVNSFPSYRPRLNWVQERYPILAHKIGIPSRKEFTHSYLDSLRTGK